MFYFNRGAVFNSYDIGYWKDRFEHSQWEMPMSQRIIGDDGLYAYVGLGLINGKDPSLVNPEAPPLAKYLIGLSIVLFDNPIFYSLVVGFACIIVYFFLAKNFLKDKFFALFTSLVLFEDPMFFSQFFKSWLDITQLFFLLLNLSAFYLITNNSRRTLWSMVSGLALGFFTQSKFPILLPIIFIFETYWFIKNKLVKEYFWFLCAFGTGIILPYLRYFALGHSLIDFLRLNKYIVSFYLKSQLTTHYGAFLDSLFLGNFPSIAGAGIDRVYEWTLFWPLSFIISLFLTVKWLLKGTKDKFIKYIGILTMISVIVFSLIPSYPRYLLLVLPFTYLLSAYFIKNLIKGKLQAILLILIPIIGLLNCWVYLIPNPRQTLNDFYYNLSNQYFQDIYQEDIANKPSGFTREGFFELSKRAMLGAQIENIEVKELSENVPLFSKIGSAKILVTYDTWNLGKFSQEKFLTLIRNDSQWKIEWNWGILLNGFGPGDSVKTMVEFGKRGGLFNGNQALAQDGNGYLISINPAKMDPLDEQNMLSYLKQLSGVDGVRLRDTYSENVIPNTYINLFTTNYPLSAQELDKLEAFKGLLVSSHQTRLYYGTVSFQSVKNTGYYECCTRLYSPANYHGISGLEKEYDDVLSGQSGGTIVITDQKGRTLRIVLDKPVKNGNNVHLSL